VARVRTVPGPTLVLGSTQTADLVAVDALRARGVALAQRRSGGGAVYLSPGDPLWLDAWIPRADPLWRPDVSVAAEWVGHWWRDALRRRGLDRLEIHTGRAVPGEWGRLVCFAGRGPGELFMGPRKIVGLSQWRAREGALFSSCAYRRWDPRPLVELLRVGVAGAGAATRPAQALTVLAAGLEELEPSLGDLATLGEELTLSFEGFGTGPGSGVTPAG
jgi:lipoate---protein ligase